MTNINIAARYEHEIPEGYEARIDGNKVIIELNESDDERIRKEIIEFIDWAESRGSVRNDWHQKKRPAEWLSYLEKHKEQKPVEWSEEDEGMRKLLIAILEVNHPNGFFKANELSTADMRGVHTEELVAWLKSLRPQPHWKPSEQ